MLPISSFFGRRLVLNPFFHFAGTIVFDEKISKVLHNPAYTAPIWETPNHPPNMKCIVTAFFGDGFVEQDDSLRTHNPSTEEVRGMEVFLYTYPSLYLTKKNFLKNYRLVFSILILVQKVFQKVCTSNENHR